MRARRTASKPQSSAKPRTPITTIYRGVLPFLASDLTRLVLLVAFPGLSLALVRVLT